MIVVPSPFVALLAFALLLAVAACAEEADPPPWSMPNENIFPDDVLAREFEYRRSVPFGEESLGLRLPCRSDWKWAALTSDTKGHHNRMVTLARVESPGDREVALEMKYLLLREDVKLEDWVDYFLDVQGLVAVSGRVATYHERRTVDVVAELREPDGRVFVARLGFFKNADRIWLTVGSAPRAKYEQYAREFGVAVTGATPATLSTAEFAEPLRDARLEAPYPLGFAFPESWTLVPADEPPDGVGAVDLRHEEAQSLRGLIKIRLYAKDRIPGFDVEKAGWSVFEELKSDWPDLQPKERLSILEATTSDFPGKGRMAVYSVAVGGEEAEVHELILDRPEAVAAVVLISFRPTRARLGHLFNRRAWEIVGMKLSWGGKR